MDENATCYSNFTMTSHECSRWGEQRDVRLAWFAELAADSIGEKHRSTSPFIEDPPRVAPSDDHEAFASAGIAIAVLSLPIARRHR
jgi:hypothetical protein